MFEERDKVCSTSAVHKTGNVGDVCCFNRNNLMRRTMEINYALSLPERGERKINTGCF